jgi:hypothetical protein
MDDDFYEVCEVLSLCPADGWRAVFIYDSADGSPGWDTDPLLGWGVFTVTAYRSGDDADEGSNRGREIHGVVLDGSYADRADSVDNFWRYLAPGAPDPAPEEVADELEERRRREAAWHEHPGTVTRASYGYGYGRRRWQLRVRPDSQAADRTIELAVGGGGPEKVATMFARLRALGIPVGSKYGDPGGTQPFWQLGWDEHQVAEAMCGRRVTIGRRGTRGPWEVVPARPEPAAAASLLLRT